MSTSAVVLDACVLVPAALRDTLLRMAGYGLYRPLWSDDILDEVERTLADLVPTGAAGARRLVAVLRATFPDAITTAHRRLISSMDNDPKDRHVLAAAVAEGARVIVTHNLKHFPEASLEPYAIEAQHPDTFLLHLLDLDADLVARVIVEQAANLRRPAHSVGQVLEHLSRDAPEAASKLAALLL